MNIKKTNLKKKANLNNINVLLTAIGCPGGPAIINGIREDSNIRLIGTDMRSNIAAKFLIDKFYKVPPGRSSKYIEKLLNIVEKEKINTVLPLATFELENLSDNKKKFQKIGCNVIVSEYKQLKIANNKYLLYNSFKCKNFIPEYRKFEDLNEFKEKMLELGFPDKKIVIKPYVSHGSIGLRIIDSKTNLFKNYLDRKPNSIYITPEIIYHTFKNKRIKDILITEFLPGKEFGVDLIVDPNTNKVINGIVRDNGKVTLSSVDCGKIVQNKELFDLARNIAEELKLSFAVNMDFKFNDCGEPKLIEINPRLPATSLLGIAAGLNFPLFSIYLSLNVRFDIVEKIKKNLSIYSYRGFYIVNKDNKIIYTV